MRSNASLMIDRPVLGIHLLGEGRRADDVREERGHGLALAGQLRGAHLLDERRRRGGGQAGVGGRVVRATPRASAWPQLAQNRASGATAASQRGQVRDGDSTVIGLAIVLAATPFDAGIYGPAGSSTGP